ncbi:MAG: isocitrate lyase/phosphoenolpyruvate mutase family protein [Ramlibacter sp.]|uniref:isocitrate lyase/PEP mutase family protein n=1 Tax=Ramlibacter sp. TaxID=1917967 RepID=UPI00260E13A0|nr:isocitrate lyase/phosphoenolpyruvate mutase family protein [Ramlibacter sp.]MDH4377596.1 isocitrate lyase/phosphoenolpyruvate mutase family protein [Ramlibacter sp.]
MTNTTAARRARLRQLVEARQGLLMPGAFNALSARVIADMGFETVYLSGAGLTNMQLGMPDLAFIGLQDVAQATSQIRGTVDLPMLVDGDTGFGNAVNVSHTVRTLERAGADAIQLEDQVFPKRCGHFNGKDVAPLGEMIGKIKAALDARTDPNFLIVARTDARSVHGFDAAVERAARMAEAGADLLFVEATESVDEVRKLPALLPLPQVMNIVIGGKTPQLPQSELAELGFGLVLYANTALQGAVLGMQRALGELQAKGILREDPSLVIPFMERQRLVDKPRFDAMEKQYAQGD